MTLDGILNIDKPAGMTSHDVVGQVRRALKTKRVGHAGTLDPDATGVLVVAVGQATRLLPFLPIDNKEYVARIVFGAATDTEDASGRVIAELDASALSLQDLETIAAKFIGEIQQIPPMVSAVHHEGRRLYELAREGVTVERTPRTITIKSLRVADFIPSQRAEATLYVTCSTGTYIRTLCADIGAALGYPAHMKTLVREAVGSFRREAALPFELLGEPGRAAAALMPIEQILGFPGIVITDLESEEIGHGRGIEAALPLDCESNDSADVFALLHRERLRALARFEDGKYKPFRVFES